MTQAILFFSFSFTALLVWDVVEYLRDGAIDQESGDPGTSREATPRAEQEPAPFAGKH